LPDSIGLYCHIPFCQKKCAYCDFFSAFTSCEGLDNYTAALKNEIKRWGGSFSRPINTIYFGGGTPSLLKGRIVEIMETVRESFGVSDNAEITAEINPSGDSEEFLHAAKKAGINRLSVGVQSANDDELRLLGRNHTAKDAENTVLMARKLGFDNITVDLMLALPESTDESFEKSIDFALKLSPQHISAYILKIEPNTLFGKRQDINFADDDTAVSQYLLLCKKLRENGFCHYEISNFAKSGFESRHNLKYWNCEEYLGIGPAAHSFLDGKRFYYPKNLQGFLKNPQIVFDGDGGDLQERIMLALRLSAGYDFCEHTEVLSYLKILSKAGLGKLCGTKFSLTEQGMLVSSGVITEILERL